MQALKSKLEWQNDELCEGKGMKPCYLQVYKPSILGLPSCLLWMHHAPVPMVRPGEDDQDLPQASGKSWHWGGCWRSFSCTGVPCDAHLEAETERVGKFQPHISPCLQAFLCGKKNIKKTQVMIGQPKSHKLDLNLQNFPFHLLPSPFHFFFVTARCVTHPCPNQNNDRNGAPRHVRNRWCPLHDHVWRSRSRVPQEFLGCYGVSPLF